MSINSEAKKQYEANRQNVAGRQTDDGDRRPGRGHILGRLVKTLFSFYPKLLPIVAVCILVQAILSAMPAIFISARSRLLAPPGNPATGTPCPARSRR